jgi:hypothetical protein
MTWTTCAAAWAATAFNDFGLTRSQGLACFNRGHHLAQFLGLRQPWQGAAFSGQVGGGRS